jgi:hypothetical protein
MIIVLDLSHPKLNIFLSLKVLLFIFNKNMKKKKKKMEEEEEEEESIQERRSISQPWRTQQTR